MDRLITHTQDTCTHCKNLCSHNGHLLTHQITHTQNLCTYCIKLYSPSCDLRQKINLNLVSFSDSQFSCIMCNKQYTDRGSLCQNKTSVHERVRYHCDQCNSILFTKVAKLRSHKASVHEGVRYSCDQCDMPVKQVS